MRKFEKEYEQSWGLSDNFVLIHTGRFIDQKNQSFVLEYIQSNKTEMSKVKNGVLGTGTY